MRRHPPSVPCLLTMFGAFALAVLAGCGGLPPKKVRTAIGITNGGVRDYVEHEQPEIERRIATLRTALEAATDEDARDAIRLAITEEEAYLRLGREIPPTLQELEDWAEGRPVPGEKSQIPNPKSQIPMKLKNPKSQWA